jgi:hypothetical protein
LGFYDVGRRVLTIVMFLKCASKSQSPANRAAGRPHVDGSAVSFVISEGIPVSRPKNQTLIPSEVHSVA